MSASAPANRAQGEVRVDLGGGVSGSIHAAQTITLETVLQVAASIWSDIKCSGVGADDDAGNDQLLQNLQERYKEFAISYPIPFRWMVQARDYDSGAFEKFLKNHVKVMYKDRKEFLATQAEYLVILFKVRTPRASGKQISRYRASILKNLENDDTIFTKAREEAEVEVRRINEEVDAERRRRMIAYLRRRRAADQHSADADGE